MMDNELLNRFFQKKLQDLLDGKTRPFPTIICEMERHEGVELVRKFCLFSPMMTPFRVNGNLCYVKEELECKQVKSYGELYVLINMN
jgi:hypothetical protein